ncbi:aspartyl protease UND-like [Coffea eugenioides]|uniref:aspartyl protease UND-like n=1 Tax=Coffea eugenioides TaxID=49369 RepID=UPI000F605C68|nr:aspartyl protease UND-like [Coffea eugenioides]
MVHYNSVESPYFDPNAANRDLEISLARLDHLRGHVEGDFNDSKVRTEIISRPLIPVFLVYLQVGEPPQEQAVAMDTGSSLFWVHCVPNHGEVHPIYKIYNPANSKSYAEELICSQYCDEAAFVNCVQLANRCYYYTKYLAGDTRGFLGRDSIVFKPFYDNQSTIDNGVFGCARKSSDFLGKYNGVLGLGTFKVSLVSQVGARKLGPRKFSYCIGNLSDPFYKDNVLFIGENIKFDGQTAPLYLEGGHYAVNLEGISFGGRLLDIDKKLLWRSDATHTGGAIIDSGSSVSFLQSIAYYKLEETILDFIGDKMERSDDISSEGVLRLCFKGNLYRDFQDFPLVTFHFENEATLNLGVESLFTLLQPNLTCLNVVDAYLKDLDHSLLGVRLQQYHYVSFDVQNKQVGFRRMDCRALRHICLICGGEEISLRKDEMLM